MDATAKQDHPGRCTQCDGAAAYLANELSPVERQDFEAHLAGCAICRQEVADLGRVVGMLRTIPDRHVSRDLAPGILAAARSGATPRLVHGRRARRVVEWAAAAAAAILIAGVWWLAYNNTGMRAANAGGESGIDLAVSWLCRVQEPDGSWDTARWGGNQQFEPALTGLSLLAILAVDPGQPSATRRHAIERAVDYLLSRQNADGSFGAPVDAAPYNDGIAALALLRAGCVIDSQTLQAATDRAVHAICAHQHGDGGWGYRNEATPVSNLSITLWQLEALRLAAAGRWPEVRGNVGRGLRWVAGVADDDGSFGYRQRRDFPEGSRTLTMMGAMSLLDPTAMVMLPVRRREAIRAQVERLAAAPGSGQDYYQSYFLSAALKQMASETSQRGLTALRKRLAAGQVREGAQTGSWNADDCWRDAGGRVYATAMASLSLK